MLGIQFFFFNDTATTEIYTLSLHDALPISTIPDPCDEQLSDCAVDVDENGVVAVADLLEIIEIGRAHV